ncbi:hypothetical protein [Streptomyces viridosporus]|uniref:hypothetical protein n=1 Tax=Streptomyces viridosporus TaxID=67581 RepID=UPI00370102B5
MPPKLINTTPPWNGMPPKTIDKRRHNCSIRPDLKAAEKLRRQRFEAVTTATTPQRLGALTAAQAEDELAAAAHGDRRSPARPDYIPHGPTPDTWARPMPLTRDAPGQKPDENGAS